MKDIKEQHTQWVEERRGVPPEEVENVSDDAVDYEVWVLRNEDGQVLASLTIYDESNGPMKLIHHDADDEEEFIGAWGSYRRAKNKLQEIKG